MRKSLTLLFFLCLFMQNIAYCASNASTQLGGNLPEVITFTGFVVNGVDYPLGSSATLVVESKEVVSSDLYKLSFTPIKVKVSSNGPGFKVNGDFTSLSKIDYSFPSGALSIVPDNQEYSNPDIPVQISADFVPMVDVTSAAKVGEYKGVIIFSVNSL